MQMGGQPYASWEVPPRVSEEKHGPHNHMLPQRGIPGPRPHRSGHYGYPGMEGEALPLHAVSQDVQRHHRHGLLAAAHHGQRRSSSALDAPKAPRASLRGTTTPGARWCS